MSVLVSVEVRGLYEGLDPDMEDPERTKTVKTETLKKITPCPGRTTTPTRFGTSTKVVTNVLTVPCPLGKKPSIHTRQDEETLERRTPKVRRNETPQSRWSLSLTVGRTRNGDT